MVRFYVRLYVEVLAALCRVTEEACGRLAGTLDAVADEVLEVSL